uniref:Endonuclease/exonuclease/phosphatase domain-containing protein n=1 Tax=Cacopsylla melanoneura TaxID=428564 RepID=A0A8D8ZCB9_9HEMI
MCKIQYRKGSLLAVQEGMVNMKIPDDLLNIKELQRVTKEKKGRSRGKNNKHDLLKVMTWNVEGLTSTLKDSPDNDLFQNSDLVFLQETMCTKVPNQLQNYYNLSVLAEKQDRGRPVGGLTILAKPNLNLQPVNQDMNRIQCKCRFGNIIGYYFNPDTHIEDIIQQLTEDLQTLDSQTSIIAGDFNCRVDIRNPRGDMLVQFMSSKYFRLLNDTSKQTYYCHNGSSCIDLIFVKSNVTKLLKNFHVITDPHKKHQRVLNN